MASDMGMMWLANVIGLVHLAYVTWVLVTPFVGNFQSRLLHAIVVPFMVLHWLLNEDTCVLTLVESALRGIPKPDSFFQQLLGPVHNFDASPMVWVATALLWLVDVHALQSRHHAELAALWNVIRQLF